MGSTRVSRQLEALKIDGQHISGDHGLVVYNFPTNLRDESGRAIGRMTVSSVLPREAMQKLRDMVVDDRRTLDAYLQRFWGKDSTYLRSRTHRSPLVLYNNPPGISGANNALVETSAPGDYATLTPDQRKVLDAMTTLVDVP